MLFRQFVFDHTNGARDRGARQEQDPARDIDTVTCACNIESVRKSAAPRRCDFYFAVNPYIDLGVRPDLACRAMGWDGVGAPPVATGLVWVINGQAIRADPKDSIDIVRALASSACAVTGINVLIGRAAFMIGDRVVYEALELYEPTSISKLYEEAIEAGNDILSVVAKAKAILDPSNPAHRAILVRQTADAMVAMARPWEVRASTAARKFLKQNWPDLSKTEVKEMITQATARIKSVPLRSVKGINKVIAVQSDRVMVGARTAAIQRHALNIGATLTSPDIASIQAAQKTSVAWLTNEYGTRATQFERIARGIVEGGLQQGLGRDEISRDLLQQFNRSLSGRSESYFNVYAGALVDRSRSRAELSSYAESSITKCIAQSVLDEATTEYCRWVHGKVIDVQEATQIMDAAEQPGMSVDEMKQANPWVRMGVDKDGARTAFVNGPQGRADLFRVASPGAGTQSPGSYSTLPGGKSLGDNGIGMPPYHGRCRTTTIADVSSVRLPQSTRPPPAVGPKPMVKPPKEQTVPNLLGSKDARSTSGVAFPGDGQNVEGFNVNARLIRDMDGKDAFEFRFKLTEQSTHGAQRTLKARGGKDIEFGYHKRDVMRNGQLKTTAMGIQDVSGGTKNAIMAATKIDETAVVAELGTAHTESLNGFVRMTIKTKDPEKAWRAFREANKKMLGVDFGTVPTAVDFEIAAKAKIVTKFNPELAVRFRGKTIDPKMLDHAFETVARKHPVARDILKDTVRRDVFSGRNAGFSKSQAEFFTKEKIPGLYHDTGAPANGLAKMIAGDNPGLLSSTTRFDRGVFIEGMSTIEDFQTGGANGVFTRVANSNKKLKECHNRYRVTIKTEELGRDDWWAHSSDRYGRSAKSVQGERWDANAISKGWKEASSGNEVMFQDGVPVSSWKNVIARDVGMKNELIAELKKMGVSKVNGKSLDDFIVLAEGNPVY